MPTRRSAVVGALFVAFTACQPAVPAALSDADMAALKALQDNFTKMAMAADYGSLVKMYYTNDAVFMAPNAPAAIGPAAIEAVLRGSPPITSFVLTIDEMVGSGGIAYAVGRYNMVMRPSGASGIPDSGKFVNVYRKQQDGSWKVARDIFNSDIPLPAPEPAKPAK